jgi:hypothetical protein
MEWHLVAMQENCIASSPRSVESVVVVFLGSLCALLLISQSLGVANCRRCGWARAIPLAEAEPSEAVHPRRNQSDSCAEQKMKIEL